MISHLIRLANKLDDLGYDTISKTIDKIIKKALDPQVKTLIESGQGWTYGCPNCNKPVEIDEDIFSRFLPEPIECPNCNNSFSPHDVGAARSVSGTGQIEGMGEEFGKHSLTEDEKGVWIIGAMGFNLFAVRGQYWARNLARYLQNNPESLYGEDMGLYDEVRSFTYPPGRDDRVFRYLGGESGRKKKMDEILSSSITIHKSPTENLHKILDTDEFPEADKDGKFLKKDSISAEDRDSLGEASDWGATPKKYDKGFEDTLRKEVIRPYRKMIKNLQKKNQKAIEDGVDPDSVADDMRW